MQLTFGDAEALGQRKQTRRERFPAEMDQVVPWKSLLALIEPHYPKTGRPGRQPYPQATMLRIHFLQQWYALSDPGMEEALYDTPVMRRFAQLGGLADIPDETTILSLSPPAGDPWPGREALCQGQRAPGAQGPEPAWGDHRRCDHHRRAELDQEPGR